MTARNINTTSSINGGELTKVVGDKIIEHSTREADNSQGGNPPTDGAKPVQVTPNALGLQVDTSGDVHGANGAPDTLNTGIGEVVEGMTGHHPALSQEGLAARKAQGKKAADGIPERVKGKQPAIEALEEVTEKVPGANKAKLPAKKTTTKKKAK